MPVPIPWGRYKIQTLNRDFLCFDLCKITLTKFLSASLDIFSGKDSGKCYIKKGNSSCHACENVLALLEEAESHK